MPLYFYWSRLLSSRPGMHLAVAITFVLSDLFSASALVVAPSVIIPTAPFTLPAQASVGLPQQTQSSVDVIASAPQLAQPVVQVATIVPPTFSPSDTVASPKPDAPVVAFMQNPGPRQQTSVEAPLGSGGLPYYAVVLIIIGSLILATLVFYIWTGVRSKSAATRLQRLFKGGRKREAPSPLRSHRERRMSYRERLQQHQRYGSHLAPPRVDSDSDRHSRHHLHVSSANSPSEQHSEHHRHHHYHHHRHGDRRYDPPSNRHTDRSPKHSRYNP